MADIRQLSRRFAKADAYHVIFEPYGWFTAYVDDSLGTLSIVSDWGNFAYRWHVAHLGGGRSLSQFLIDAEPEYIATKLHVDLGGISHIDSGETKKALKKELLSQRRQRKIESWEARHDWEEINYWDCDLYHAGPSVGFVDNWWEYRRTSYKGSYTNLLTIIIPSLKEAIYEEKTVCVA